MRLSKDMREAIRIKFQGRCAYCGCELGDRWHVDHMEPVMREVKTVKKNGSYRLVSGKPLRPENDRLDNLVPACPSCNIDKHCLTVEEWRANLHWTINTLNKNRAYKFAKKFGLVEEVLKPIRFYFEGVPV